MFAFLRAGGKWGARLGFPLGGGLVLSGGSFVVLVFGLGFVLLLLSVWAFGSGFFACSLFFWGGLPVSARGEGGSWSGFWRRLAEAFGLTVGYRCGAGGESFFS